MAKSGSEKSKGADISPLCLSVHFSRGFFDRAKALFGGQNIGPSALRFAIPQTYLFEAFGLFKLSFGFFLTEIGNNKNKFPYLKNCSNSFYFQVNRSCNLPEQN